jgi:tetratricopeptide (TPR) repeat protein
MSNIKPIKPSHTFGYWRPWKEETNLFDSYLDYVRDTSLVKYGADTIGNYINQASKEQIQAIDHLGQAIGRGMNLLSNKMSDINDSLIFLNRNIDIQIEQQRLSNLLLQNISELLRIPDKEKERQHSIELGLKFFVNAKKNKELYEDALEELLKAESLMKQDYFVLHRIGCIYLYVEKLLNPEKALDYFQRAAKYASVESDRNAVRLVNVLNNSLNSKDKNVEKQIRLLAADSYEKAAFAAYILGQFSDAAKYQAEVLSVNNNPQNRFLLSKYQIRNKNIDKGIKNLSKCIDDDPLLALAVFKEIDLINEPEVIKLIFEKNKEIDNEINELIVNLKNKNSNDEFFIDELIDLSKRSFEEKVEKFNLFEKKVVDYNDNRLVLKNDIESLINLIKHTLFCTFDNIELEDLIQELKIALELPYERMIDVFAKVKKQVDEDKLQIGSIYAGGIVFYIDPTGKHGLVCASKDFGRAIWGIGHVGADGGFADGGGIRNTREIYENASWITESKPFGWLTGKSIKKPITTAARLCIESNHNGYKDWYLPTVSEFVLIYKNLYISKKIDIPNIEYWTSNELVGKKKYSGHERFVVYANSFNLKNGESYDNYKSNNFNVRAVRAF